MGERMDASIHKLSERLDGVERALAEYADALMVPRVRQKVEACLPATAALLFTERFDHTWGHCSAVPVSAGAGLLIPWPPPGPSPPR